MPAATLCKIAKPIAAGKNEPRWKASHDDGLAMLHLLMAACWLILGAFLLVWQWSNPNASSYIGGTGIPLGWFGIAMAGYNLLRWWLGRRFKGSRRYAPKANTGEQIKTSPPPDPDFNFTNDPSLER
jgi:hypothetical protein